MRIAFLTTQFPATSETFVLGQITGMLDRGHDVSVFAVHPGTGEIEHPQVQRYDLLAKTRYIGAASAKLPRVLSGLGLLAQGIAKTPGPLLKSLNPARFGSYAASLRLLHAAAPFLEAGPFDVIHCHFGPNGEIGRMLKDLGLPGRLVVTFHGYDLTNYVRARGDRTYAGLFAVADLLLPISDLWRQRLADLGAPAAKVRVHRVGIDLERFPWRARAPQPGAGTRLLSVGRLVEKKGLEYAIRAFATVRRRLPAADLTYDLIGDGPLREDLAALARNLGVAQNITFHGARPHDFVRSIMDAAHLFLLPSVTAASGDMEGIPVVLMEAMARGLPVISTRHSGIPELVEDGVSGFLVAERDHAALADRLEDLLQNPHRWTPLARAARTAVEARHDIRRLNAELEELYGKLQSGGEAR